MKLVSFVVICLWWLGIQGEVHASEARFHFVPGATLRGAKVIIAEFEGPARSSLGTSLSYLIWHELRTVLGDPSGVDILWLSAALR